jgi:tripartite-type tricarboxylate transporter receptor subunit TctC
MAQGVLDMIAGRAQLTITGFPAVATQVKAGRLALLATAGSRRSALLPEVPTIAESALPGFDVASWQGLVVPKGTSAPIISRLNDETNKALRSPVLRKQFADQGVEVLGGSPEELAARIRGDLEKWTRVVKAAGIKPD